MRSLQQENGDAAVTATQVHNVTNGYKTDSQPSRAIEIEGLIKSVLAQLIPFLTSADQELRAHQVHDEVVETSLVDTKSPSELTYILTEDGTLTLPEHGSSQAGLLRSLSSILSYSVNTSSPGFLDKLYSAPLAPGIAADLTLSVLNTNLHVYQVSPALTLIETHVTKALASLFGLKGSRAGGINVQGGSASNMTSIVIARNTLYPNTKVHGNNADGLDLVLFTSEHGHYSITKAAQQCGFGSAAVISIPVDETTGQIRPEEFEDLVVEQKSQGRTPFYVNATAGTTVLGSFDPFTEISAIAKKHGLWMHIDGAWGGSFAFSNSLRQERLNGAELADSIAINPHKMLGVPVTCSFLILKDLRDAERACTLRAGYLFHDVEEAQDLDNDENPEQRRVEANGQGSHENTDEWSQPVDLADLTLQCGRRGDSLKLFLSWQYYGTLGYALKIENAYSTAAYFADLVSKNSNFQLVSQNPPPCLQVCFYYAPGRTSVYQVSNRADESEKTKVGKRNSVVTSRITRLLVRRGFMVDYAPALGHETEKGAFFRVVTNISMVRETVERLVQDIEVLGKDVARELKDRSRL
ncbi:glutamate decarboxylase [Exophiala aquamarina CBS 119918]|uniref:Glutamate decarboxylase n=1 Tax=Exophiala aquamarina CBS 119918 TaxID=1182545 RepID=A0A072Q4K3_9EURO|nr:glutamate decarboxylase [Exophiala aquamarina CBS 119918]KEF62815.1 glutamate decarboxylase [Exophiala aquamarina CBS 119918]